MENRLSKFIKNRRSRLSEPIHERNPPASTTSLNSSTTRRPSFFSAQSRAQTSSHGLNEPGIGNDGLRSFAYDSCALGKPPTFVTKASPGNGPIKLQASRRLSTGELIATPHEGALKDIRDGQYVVGKKERPVSRNPRKSTRVPSSAGFGQSTPTSPSSINLTSPRTCSNVPSAEPNHSLPAVLGELPIPETLDHLGLGLITSAPAASYSMSSRGSCIEQRSLGARARASRESLASLRTTSTHDVNATLAALKKAEYSRLTGLYGPEAAIIAFTRASSNPSSPSLQGLSPTIPELPKHMDQDTREHEPTRVSGLSGASASCDESLGAHSPQRTSYVSSQADSTSGTAPTSFTDDEYVATREDIKSMVEQIRSTYLAALDTHGSPPQRTKSRKKRKKPRSRSSSISIGVDKNRPALPIGRQTWHPENRSPDIYATRRVNSQPVDTVSRLPPIPASPTRDTENGFGIRRADSTTLGELMADMTRAQIKTQSQSKQTTETSTPNHPRPTTPTAKFHRSKESWLSIDSDATGSPARDIPTSKPQILVHSRVISTTSINDATFEALPVSQNDDFEELYQDLFGKDTGDLWTSSLFSENGSSMLVTHSTKSNHDSTQYSTPRKTPRITSIPESPEYTHLADPRRPEGNFI